MNSSAICIAEWNEMHTISLRMCVLRQPRRHHPYTLLIQQSLHRLCDCVLLTVSALKNDTTVQKDDVYNGMVIVTVPQFWYQLTTVGLIGEDELWLLTTTFDITVVCILYQYRIVHPNCVTDSNDDGYEDVHNPPDHWWSWHLHPHCISPSINQWIPSTNEVSKRTNENMTVWRCYSMLGHISTGSAL